MSELKLTKELADYLLAGIDCIINVNPLKNNAEIYKIKKFIKGLTENEFPCLHMRPKHVDDIEEIKIYQIDCDNAGQKCIVIYSYEEYTHMSREQFKVFVQDCNRIVEWIDETSDKEY